MEENMKKDCLEEASIDTNRDCAVKCGEATCQQKFVQTASSVIS